jgi:DNA polymerase-4
MLAHIDLDAFYASVEELDQPRLKGRPIIVGGLGGRSVVAACSYPARRFGVRSAMPMAKARALCPQGIFLAPRMDRYQQASREVMSLLARFSPAMEQISIDEALLDLKGVTHLWGGSARQCALMIKETIRRETGLICSIGVAPLRFLAKIASERCKPDGLLIVEESEPFLSTVALREVSGVGAQTLRCLNELGTHQLTDLRAFTPQILERRLGKAGLNLWLLAQGRDERRVGLPRQPKSISHETTFARDLAETDVILSHLMDLCQKTGSRLRWAGLCAGTLTLKVKYPDFKQKTFSNSSSKPTNHTLDIFNRLRGFAGSQTNIRLLGVGASNLCPARQDDLFHDRRSQCLHEAEDYLQQRFGPQGLTRARTLLISKE